MVSNENFEEVMKALGKLHSYNICNTAQEERIWFGTLFKTDAQLECYI